MTCHQTGYFDRTVIGELLVTNTKFQENLKTKSSTQTLDQIAQDLGMTAIFEDGVNRVNQGITTMDELHRVLEKENRDLEIKPNIYRIVNN